MNLYTVTYSLPGFCSRFMERSYNAQYDGNHRVALMAAQHAGRCEIMYCGSEFDLDETAIYLYTKADMPFQQFHDYLPYTVHRFLIHGGFHDIVCPSLRDAYRLANILVRLSDDDFQYLTDESHAVIVKSYGNFVIIGTPLLSMIGEFFKP